MFINSCLGGRAAVNREGHISKVQLKIRDTFFVSLYISGKLLTSPFPKAALTLTSHLGKMLAYGRGRWVVSQKCIMIQKIYP